MGGAPPPPLDFAPQGVKKTQFLTPEDQSPEGGVGGLTPTTTRGQCQGRTIERPEIDKGEARRQSRRGFGDRSIIGSNAGIPSPGAKGRRQHIRPPELDRRSAQGVTVLEASRDHTFPINHDPLRKHIISPAGRSTPLALHHDAERQAARGLSVMTADVLSSKDTPVPFALSVVSYPRSPSARRHLDALRSAMGATPGAGASRHQWRRCQSPITSMG